MSIKLGSSGIIIPYSQAYVGDDLVYTTNVGDALLTENGRPLTTELGEHLDYESVPYTMLDWIESTGTQYINTGVLNSATIKIECKLSAEGVDCLCGSEYTWDGQRFKFGISGPARKPYYGYGTSNNTVTATSGINTPYTFYISRGEQWIKDNSGTTIKSSSDTSLTRYSTIPILLFGMYETNEYQLAPIMRIYYCKIWNGDTLVRDFIPVLDENNVACLFDRVSETYFYNQGTGNFAPSETSTYTALNYLQSTGTQYINTGVIPTNTYKIDCNIARTDLTINDGVHGSNYNSIWGLYFYLASNGKVACAYGTQNVYVVDATTYNNTNAHRYILDLTSGGLATKVDGTSYATKPYSAIANGVAVYIFKCNDGGTSRKASIKLHSFAIYNNNVLVREYIPVLRKSDNEPCLYDLVNGEFYTNAGTGTFLYG